jgi:Hypothetical protein (DUF2513)
MKRDMDLVRLMLLRTEAIGVDEEEAKRLHAECEKYDERLRAHHIAIMKEAGLIDGFTTNDASGTLARGAILRLTWQGHEFLDAARNDTTWRKAKDKLLKPALGVTFTVLTEFLKAEGRRLAGLP